MSNAAIIFLGLLAIAVTVGSMAFGTRQRKALARLRDEEDAIVAEERRMFGFLHDLGEAISRADNHGSLHRLIVEGMQKVIDGAGGAIYVLDAEGKSLVPKYYSEHCAPLIEVPAHVYDMEIQNPGTLLSFLRLQVCPASDGLPGRVYRAQRAEFLSDKASPDTVGLAPVMIGPLSSGARRVGVLAVVGQKGRTFSAIDFEVFNSLVEQSAFALANAMAHQEAHDKQQIEAELRSASEVQRILLPEADPVIRGVAIDGRNLPARVLSGDYYDYLDLADGKLGVVIADVSGKGTAAAIISAMCRALIRAKATADAPPSVVLSAVNRLIAEDIREDMFVTLVYLTLDCRTGDIVLARAGHTSPLIWRKATQSTETIVAPGMAVGIDSDGSVFERVTRDVTAHLDEGDCLLLYTDGISEAMDTDEEMFGEERIETVFAESAGLGPKKVVERILTEVDHFVGGQRSLDDITLIAVQKTA